jgi:hypothetical protein
MPMFCDTSQLLALLTFSTDQHDYTTVMGMLGAFGNTNLTSSNFPRRRHVSASDTLWCVSCLRSLASLADISGDVLPTCPAEAPRLVTSLSFSVQQN